MKKRVALIFGGEGMERKISEFSAENLATLIDTDLYTLLMIGINDDGEWYIYSGARENISGGAWQKDRSKLKKTFPVKLGERSGFLSDGKIIAVDCAIPCLHGDFGEDGIIQGALTAAHIRYVGQDVYASAFTSDKSYTKLAAAHLGIPSARWRVLTDNAPNNARAEAELCIGYPMFLKPTRLGSSYGAHPVRSKADFDAAYTDAYSYESRVLAEELIEVSYELECAYLGADGILLAPYGKITTGDNFYGYDEKYRGSDSVVAEVTADGIDPAIQSSVIDYSTRLIEFLGIRHLSRIDFLIDKGGRVYFNEINAFPGMTRSSLYPALIQKVGIADKSFINRLIESVCN